MKKVWRSFPHIPHHREKKANNYKRVICISRYLFFSHSLLFGLAKSSRKMTATTSSSAHDFKQYHTTAFCPCCGVDITRFRYSAQRKKKRASWTCSHELSFFSVMSSGAGIRGESSVLSFCCYYTPPSLVSHLCTSDLSTYIYATTRLYIRTPLCITCIYLLFLIIKGFSFLVSGEHGVTKITSFCLPRKKPVSKKKKLCFIYMPYHI